jgi:hypothetical protein
MPARWSVLAIPLCAGAAWAAATSDRTQPRFLDVSRLAGAEHLHQRPAFDARLANVMPWIASLNAGLAVADVNGDGHEDIYFLNSRQGSPNALYLGDGRFRFREAAEEFGLARLNDETGVSMDAAFGDLDNDGDQDLFLASYGRSRVLRNDGRRFVDVTARAGLSHRGNAASALLFDYDGDGFLDVMVGEYFADIDLWNVPTTRVLQDSFDRARNGGRDLLYHNNGDGTFTEVGARAGVDHNGWTLDMGAGDLDNDGDPDVYVANDFGEDVLYRNNGDGTFTNVTRSATGGDFDAGMNVDIADQDNDGQLDIYVTNITNASIRQGNMLWWNQGGLRFLNVAKEAGAWDGGWGWGARFLDFDNDGDLDILTVNGFVSAGPVDVFRSFGNFYGSLARADVSDARSWPDLRGLSMSGYEATRLFENTGAGYVEVGRAAGVAAHGRDGRGVAVADFDEDGDPDVVVTNCGQPSVLYRNDGGNANRWLRVKLRGTRSNRDGIGARLELETADLRQIREIEGGNGFSAQSTKTAHFGLGRLDQASSLRVRWPSGLVQRLDGIRPDQTLVVTERGEGDARRSRP